MLHQKIPAMLISAFLLLAGCASSRGEDPAVYGAPVFAGETARQEAGEAAVQRETEPVRFALEDAGLSISLPGDLAVVTRTEVRNRALLDATSLNLQNIRRFMRETRTWLYALDGSLHQEILVVSYPTQSRGYGQLSDAELDAVGTSAEMRRVLGGLGTDARVYGFYRSGDTAWFMIDVTQISGGQSIYATEFYTIQNGRAVTVVLQNSVNFVSEDQHALLKSAVDSIIFSP